MFPTDVFQVKVSLWSLADQTALIALLNQRNDSTVWPGWIFFYGRAHPAIWLLQWHAFLPVSNRHIHGYTDPEADGMMVQDFGHWSQAPPTLRPLTVTSVHFYNLVESGYTCMHMRKCTLVPPCVLVFSCCSRLVCFRQAAIVAIRMTFLALGLIKPPLWSKFKYRNIYPIVLHFRTIDFK